jgi:DNA-binding transcriptional MerR regulator
VLGAACTTGAPPPTAAPYELHRVADVAPAGPAARLTMPSGHGVGWGHGLEHAGDRRTRRDQLAAVRHYHEVGLLPEPERRSNGYKQYGVAHLVRLLRITRLVDLGFSLARIAELGEDDHHPTDALRTADAELGATIERLQRARVELGLRGGRQRDHRPPGTPALSDRHARRSAVSPVGPHAGRSRPDDRRRAPTVRSGGHLGVDRMTRPPVCQAILDRCNQT